MAKFGSIEPADDDADDPVVGVASSADGQVQASVAANGKLQTLTISPDLLRRTRSGSPVVGSALLAEEITRVVNSAIDDLVRRAALRSVPGPAALTSELADISADLGRALNTTRAELERAERRITDIQPGT